MSSFLLKRLPVIFSWAAICLFWAPPAGIAAGVAVQCRGQRLDIRAEEAPLAEVLRKISETTGLSVEAGDSLTETVSLDMKDRSLEDCLGRLLRGRNYVLLFNEQGDGRPVPAMLRILGGHGGKRFFYKPSGKRDRDRGKMADVSPRPARKRAFPAAFKRKIKDQRLSSLKTHRGIRVVRVPRGSLLWQAGLRSGDVVRDVNGKAVRDTADFLQKLQGETRSGTLVRIGRSTQGDREDPIYLEFGN